MAYVIRRAGTRKHRVTIKLPSTSQGSRGQRSGVDSTMALKVPCSIETLTGRESEQGHQLYPDATLSVELDYREYPSLTTDHYLEFGTRRLNIIHLNNVDELNIKWIAICGESK